MRTVAIVHYARHGPTRAYARELEGALQHAGHLAEQIPVRNAAANDIVFYDGLVLVGPPSFGRLHGIALARSIVPDRHSAVVVVGGSRPADSYRRLFKRGEWPYVTLFHEALAGGDPIPQDDGGPPFATLDAVVHWVGEL